MEFLTASATDIGTRKSTNQDSFSIKVANTSQGKAALLTICDGMGGLSKGEVASAQVIRAMDSWFLHEFPLLLRQGFTPELLADQWNALVQRENLRIRNHGARAGINLGTTLTAMLCLGEMYYLVHIGDCRVYEISQDSVQRLTHDQTLVQREVDQGILSQEQALTDPRRSVLLQCIGVGEVMPTFSMGKLQKDAVYLFCCDGFYHELTDNELFRNLHPSQMVNREIMANTAQALIQLVEQRGESDNITTVLARTY